MGFSDWFIFRLPQFFNPLNTIFQFLVNRPGSGITELWLRKPFSYIFTNYAENINQYTENEYLLSMEVKVVQELAQLLTERTKEDTIGNMFMYAWHVEYDSSVTDLNWTERRAMDTITRGYGNCADRSILLVSLLRLANIPARIVTGRLVDSDSSHAWVEVYYWGAWRTLDPGNNLFLLADEGWHSDILDEDMQEWVNGYYEVVDKTVNLNSDDPFYESWAEWIALIGLWPSWVPPWY